MCVCVCVCVCVRARARVCVCACVRACMHAWVQFSPSHKSVSPRTQTREGRHLEQNTLLKQEIRKLERDRCVSANWILSTPQTFDLPTLPPNTHTHTHTCRSRETENMEYLKNVMIHFMSADSTGREQMITPIATILHFSPDEVWSYGSSYTQCSSCAGHVIVM